MVMNTPSASTNSSSCSSSGEVAAINKIKFLSSYGGKILPRHPDRKLRYVGGETRLLAVDHSILFSELHAKMKELCGWSSVSLRCQLPTEDLDSLVSVTSDEDLKYLVEEYHLKANNNNNNTSLKIRAFLYPPRTVKTSSSPRRRCVHREGYSPVSFLDDNRHHRWRHHHLCPYQ